MEKVLFAGDSGMINRAPLRAIRNACEAVTPDSHDFKVADLPATQPDGWAYGTGEYRSPPHCTSSGLILYRKLSQAVRT